MVGSFHAVSVLGQHFIVIVVRDGFWVERPPRLDDLAEDLGLGAVVGHRL